MRSNPSTAIVCLPLLDAAACDAVLDSLAPAAWRDAQVSLPGYGAGAHSIRSTSVVEVGGDALTRVLGHLEELNRNLYVFKLSGLRAEDPTLAMRYQPGDHFDWHIDNATEGVATRKLSFTLQLSASDDYDGGDLEFALYSASFGGAAPPEQRLAARARGAITVFPAFHLHRVTPVTRGCRVALVGWMHGPRFR